MKYLVFMFGIAFAGSASAATIGGVEFPEGEVSFADALVDLSFGDPAPTHVNFIDGNEALGIPDYEGGLGEGAVSLGRGGSITLQFTDNALTGSGSNADDLHIFEVGPDIEDTFVEISKNGSDWFEVGKVFGSTSSIDIDQYGFGIDDLFFFVRLTDDPNEGGATGSTVGADIDAVGAISTQRVSEVPLPASAMLILTGLGGLGLMRRRRK